MKKQYHILLFLILCFSASAQEKPLRILNFYGDNGYVHDSQAQSVALIDQLGLKNNWKVVSTDSSSVFNLKKLWSFDVVIFNNNCGNKGQILSKDQQSALQQYIRNGGGFVGIHCAGAIWNEGGNFQHWYEKMIGTKLVDHPKVQKAKLRVEDTTHLSTGHLPKTWELKDEWHRFAYNPRENVNVLLSVDENTYEGDQKMGGDHPFTWYQYYDGGRSFFTSLGHTSEIYGNPDFQQLLEGGILWAANTQTPKNLPVKNGLLLDLDADYNVSLEDGNRINAWGNHLENGITPFVKQDEGRKIKGAGRPRLRMQVPELNGHNAVVFHRQELVNFQEDAFDHLTTGSGYTWLAVLSVYDQVKGKPGINAFFGNLRNTNLDKQGQFEGFWGGFNAKRHLWMSSRNAKQKGPFNENSPQVIAPTPLKKSKYHLVMGRMEAGEGLATMELYINTTQPVATGKFPVNPKANPSKMVIGQERDATNHPGAESFDGELARFLIFERSLSTTELQSVADYLLTAYKIEN